MATLVSPQAITATASHVVKFNSDRKELFLQNNGKKDIYFKKQIPGKPPVVPTKTDYDFILYNATGKDSQVSIKIASAAGFMAVAPDGDSELAVMETVVYGSSGVC